MTSIRRWLVFNLVGALGFFVQLGALMLLIDGLGWHYLAATALAVETAVIHNFFWHEHWTWADRGKPGRAGLVRRFLGFNLANGAVSIVGNLICMRLFMAALQVHYLAANVLAIAICSIVNYVLSDRLVFKRVGRKPDRQQMTNGEEDL